MFLLINNLDKKIKAGPERPAWEVTALTCQSEVFLSRAPPPRYTIPGTLSPRRTPSASDIADSRRNTRWS